VIKVDLKKKKKYFDLHTKHKITITVVIAKTQQEAKDNPGKWPIRKLFRNF
jgi:hypothetical protein